MNKRMRKKWIKRYLHPLVNNLEIVQCYGLYEDENLENGMTQRRYYNSSAIVNGYVVHEGCRYPFGGGFKQSVLRARTTLISLKDVSKKTFLRVYPEHTRGILYMRVLTEVK